jgi:hypothetical protein
MGLVFGITHSLLLEERPRTGMETVMEPQLKLSNRPQLKLPNRPQLKMPNRPSFRRGILGETLILMA